jgi:hypothetical protein
MPKKKSKLVPYDDHRGYNGIGGWWISFKEAKEKCCGKEEWWKHQGYKGLEITPAHYPVSPADKPVWLFENGDMYLGQWKYSRQHRWPVEHGLGITYNNYPIKYKGLVCIGKWGKGHIHGMAKSFWLESSPTWRKNEFPASAIRQKEGNKTISRPFNYLGPYNMSYRSGPGAIVTLKDGTQHIGPWQEHAPVGDWWTDHRLSLPSSSITTNSQGHSTSSVARRPRRGRLTSNNLDSKEQHNSEEEEPPQGQERDRNHPGRLKRSAPACPGISEDDGRKRAARPLVVTSIHRNEGLESAASRNMRRPDSRSFDEIWGASEDSDTGQNIDAAGPTQINTSVEDRDEDSRVLEIVVWLMNDVIGFGYDNTDEAKSYARQIVAFGAHSVQMIVACLTSSDVEGFEWMRPLHQRRLSETLRKP